MIRFDRAHKRMRQHFQHRASSDASLRPCLWLISALVAVAIPSTAVSAQTRSGQSLVEAHCAACHATGASGASPNHAAPPLRSIGTRYDLDELAERLRRGTILAGHPDMPVFRFSRSEAHAIRDYLSDIQK